ncbi:hypothetical protein [Jeotgalibacillus salarius]|uniref:Uncharacterized protein n=1 Tax=Jeotgalibacillus salarius TaxID=546023 RepID=A0A4Y8LD60_9BACL|nr:hypothetical protein [Jeotgalibacillus salarius]TFD98466.1 hypothetical protein E2626_15365 [Jeotgalibacillus salarius]
MEPIHLWLSIYDKQTKKPLRQIQPILPAVILAYQQSFKLSAITAEEATDKLGILLNNHKYLSLIKDWEQEGYFTIEERRFGSMVSRLYHLKKLSSAAYKDLDELKNRTELHMMTNEDLHYLAFGSLLSSKHAAYRTNSPWLIAAESVIQQQKTL